MHDIAIKPVLIYCAAAISAARPAEYLLIRGTELKIGHSATGGPRERQDGHVPYTGHRAGRRGWQGGAAWPVMARAEDISGPFSLCSWVIEVREREKEPDARVRVRD